MIARLAAIPAALLALAILSGCTCTDHRVWVDGYEVYPRYHAGYTDYRGYWHSGWVAPGYWVPGHYTTETTCQ